MSRSILRRFARSENGSVILETALVLTILLMLMFGIFDVGRALYTANNLVSAAREGARFAAVRERIQEDSVKNVVKDTVIARFGAYRFGGGALIRDSVTVTPVLAGGIPASVRVTVSYPFTWISPLPRLLRWTGSNQRAVHAQSEYRYEF